METGSLPASQPDLIGKPQYETISQNNKNPNQGSQDVGSGTEMSSDLSMPVYTPTHIQTQSSHIDPAGSVVEPGLTVAGKVQLISASAPCSFCARHVGLSYFSLYMPPPQGLCTFSARGVPPEVFPHEVPPISSVLLTHCLSQGLFPDLSVRYILTGLSPPFLVLCCLALVASCCCLSPLATPQVLKWRDCMLGAGHLPQDCWRPESPVCPHVCCLVQDFSAGVQPSLFHHDCSGLLWCRLGAAQPQCLNLCSGRRPLTGGMCVGECCPCIHWLALAWLLGTGVPTGARAGWGYQNSTVPVLDWPF